MRRVLVCALVGVLLIVVVHLYLLDGLPGLVLRFIDSSEDTVFSASYSEGTFRWLRKGTTEEEILDSLGPPLAKVWDYDVEGDTRVSFRLEGRRVSEVFFDRTHKEQTVNIGDTSEDVIARLGHPNREAWIFSVSPSDSSYRRRSLILENGILIKKRHSFYVD